MCSTLTAPECSAFPWSQGIVVQALPREARLVYVTPSHQYPLGVAMSLERRLALLRWADEHDAAIVEDDYDTEFRYGGRPLEPLQTLDETGRVLYVGSFSKTLLPSLRLGFIVSPPPVRRALVAAKYVTDWHSSVPLQAALAAFIEDGGFARHLRRMRGVYQRRHQLVTSILSAEFREHLEAIPSSVGLHVTALARTSSYREMETVLRLSIAAGVAVQQVPSFDAGTPTPPGLMIGYGAIATDQIEEGMRLLRSCFEADTRSSP